MSNLKAPQFSLFIVISWLIGFCQDERGRVMRRTILRYINLAIVHSMTRFSVRVKKRFPTFDHLVAAGAYRVLSLVFFRGKNWKWEVEAQRKYLMTQGNWTLGKCNSLNTFFQNSFILHDLFLSGVECRRELSSTFNKKSMLLNFECTAGGAARRFLLLLSFVRTCLVIMHSYRSMIMLLTMTLCSWIWIRKQWWFPSVTNASLKGIDPFGTYSPNQRGFHWRAEKKYFLREISSFETLTSYTSNYFRSIWTSLIEIAWKVFLRQHFV